MSALSVLYWKSLRQFIHRLKSIRYQSRFKVFFVSCFGITCEAGLCYLFYDSFKFLDSFGGIGGFIVGRLFSLFFLGVGSMLIVSSLVTSYATFFRSEEMPFLMTRPLDVSQIVIYKYFETTFFASWAFFFVIIPYVGSYAWYEKLSPFFVVWTLLFSFPFLMVCGALGTILMLLIVRWVPRARATRLVLAGLVVAALVTASIVSRDFYDPDASARFNLAKLVPGMMLASNILLPSSWIAEGIMSLTRGEWGRGLMLWGVLMSSALMGFVIVEWMGSRLHYECWQRTMAGASGPRGRGRLFPALERALRKLSPDVRAVVLKDVMTFFRDPVQWSQALVFFGLLGIYFAHLGTFDYSSFAGYWINLMAFLNVFSVSAVICSLGARFIYPQLSLEGQGFWILGLSPTTMKRVLLAKFGTSLAGMLTISVVLTLLSASMLKTVLPVRVTAVCLGAAVALAVCGMSTGLGAIFLDLRERNPAAIVSGFGGTLNLVLSLGFMLAVILPFGLVFHLRVTERITDRELLQGLVLGGAWMLVLTLLFTIIPLALGIRSLKNRDY